MLHIQVVVVFSGAIGVRMVSDLLGLPGLELESGGVFSLDANCCAKVLLLEPC